LSRSSSWTHRRLISTRTNGINFSLAVAGLLHHARRRDAAAAIFFDRRNFRLDDRRTKYTRVIYSQPPSSSCIASTRFYDGRLYLLAVFRCHGSGRYGDRACVRERERVGLIGLSGTVSLDYSAVSRLFDPPPTLTRRQQQQPLLDHDSRDRWRIRSHCFCVDIDLAFWPSVSPSRRCRRSLRNVFSGSSLDGPATVISDGFRAAISTQHSANFLFYPSTRTDFTSQTWSSPFITCRRRLRPFDNTPKPLAIAVSNS